ncbi:MAG TPA: CapA family protein [Gaiellaceae bacterium]|nr:CapA family protein [Gaiellaceae bacterium]
MRPRFSPVALALAGIGAACAGAGLAAVWHPPTTARAAELPLTVRSVLPAWRAPGVQIPVVGFAGAAERVVLRVNGRRADAAVSGPRGGFRLGFETGRPGRYRLVVAAGDRVTHVGDLTVRPLVLAAVGDVTFGEQVGPAIETHGAAYPWVGVAHALRRADLTIGNLETAVSERGVAAAKEFTFRGAPAALAPMRARAGFDALTLANNHSGDYGRDALLDTIAAVRAAGIRSVGAGADSAQARRPAVLVEGGLRVALLGYSDVNPLGFPATATSAGTAKADAVAIATDVRAARRRADVVVCFFHWGTELRPEPDARQRELATAALRAGAAVVLGAHPHVLGPVTRPSRRTLVAWTLGNFVFPSAGATARTAILRVELGRAGVYGYRLQPVAIDGFRPRLVAARS